MMSVLATILFLLALLALAYTYVGYPMLVALAARRHKMDGKCFSEEEELPRVSVLMAVHNEERVIRQKLDSLVQQRYPKDKLRIFIGSDRSTDGTNAILDEYAAKYASLNILAFRQRQGKPGIINQLAMEAAGQHAPLNQSHVFVITDASVIMHPDVVRNLSRHFKKPNLAIVDAHMQHTGMDYQDISDAENSYISWEGRLKRNESLAWQYMVGPFGGCYALRSDYFTPVPDTFLVDDFYITLHAFRSGGKAINEPEALCFEPVGHEIGEEFRRKARISAGNIQNALHFRDMWWPPLRNPQFAVFSHKILRWLGPIWLLLLLVTAGLLSGNLIFRVLFITLTSLYAGLPLADHLAKRMGLHWKPLRGASYFLAMNLALLAGYFRYFKGIQTNVWQPPKRQ